ncbi:MAG TPA: hypothetical protein VNM87_11915, partial [Candidatus Udaeobacter sp.]|nr:hypothetical protein [Candidatus Udaeobacter sp.]
MDRVTGTASTAPRLVSLDSRSQLARIDRQGMLGLVAAFPAQIEEASQIGQKAAIGVAQGPFRAIVVAGMGGSAVGGDFLRSVFADQV